MMLRKTWWVAAIVAVASLAIGIGLGLAWARRSQPVVKAPADEQSPPSPSAAIAQPPTGARIAMRKDVEKLFGAVAQTATVLKFSGTDSIKFWCEVKRGGQAREIVFDVSSTRFFSDSANLVRDGDFIWLRIKEADAPGREIWRLAIVSDIQFSWAARPIDLFGKKGRAAPKSGWSLSAVRQTEAPNPLPRDRAVCLKEYRETTEGGKQALEALAVSLWGALAVPSVGPFPACALCAAGGTDEFCTIRLMCEVIPARGK